MFSVIIPAYNEETRLPATLATLKECLPGHECEIIVVDDGSTDCTASIAEKAGCRVVCQSLNMGKGAAVKAGIKVARGELILVTDADLATPLTELPKLLAALEGGADVAMGSRAVSGAVVKRASFKRKLSGKVFSIIVRHLTGLKHFDTQCGFKLFRGTVAKELFILAECQGFAYDVEILVLAKALNLTVKEVGVNWIDMPGSKVKLVRDSLRMVKELLEIRKRLDGYFPGTTGTSVLESVC